MIRYDMKRFLLLLLLLLITVSLHAQTKVERIEMLEDDPGRPMTFEDMYAMGRVSDPQVSPDGETILYVVTHYSLESNKSNSEIYAIDIKGENSVRLTDNPAADANPRWSPDGQSIAFISSRENGSQIWMMNPDGTGLRRVTDISTGIDAFTWTPTGRHILYTSSVYPDCKDDACNRARDEEKANDPVKARKIDHLPYRVWNHWRDGKYSHVFAIPSAGGVPVELTPGPYDTPPIDLGSNQDFTASPDGMEVAFVKNTDKMLAASTNNDIWLVGIDGSNPHCITTGNKANDNQPVYSPDGKYIAYRAMSRIGYEADKYDLKIYERASKRTWTLTVGVDRSVDEIPLNSG